MEFLVTVKLPMRGPHDPINKRAGVCPAQHITLKPRRCTDTTGAHHTFLVDSAAHLQRIKNDFHITRVEEV